MKPAPALERPPDPTAIGPFVVLRKLGEGAMGVVYAGYDVGLDRKVALKLVRRHLLDKPAVRARMIREAQAMARLSNPYVVQVYQVGEHGDGIYVAMEYVDGLPLGEWLRAQSRPWPVVLRTVCDAGRGLAAAHAAGLVHRDFKPDNVLVDAAGRARVLDFGLVQTGEGGRDPELAETAGGAEQAGAASTLSADGNTEGSGLHWSVRLTQAGKACGTPAYMSPEQHFGEPAGPYSDQFSFAITLYEALYGARPFVGDTWASVREQVQRGVIPPPPPDSRVPRRIYKVIARALALAPEERWASLDIMIDALEHDPWRGRARVAGLAGLLVVASAGSYAAALRQMSAGPGCDALGRELVGAWDPARAQAVARAFEATGAPFAADVQERALAHLGAYADAWLAERAAVCEAHVARAQTDLLTDLRLACLGRRKAHLAALVDIFAAADREVVEHAVQAVAALPAIAACSDAEGLLAAVAPPDDPQTAARVEALRGQLARTAALADTGQYERGLELAARVRAEAEALGYAPLVAEAALGEGSLQTAAAQPVLAERSLEQALRLAIAHDLHAVAAEAAAKRLFVIGDGLGRRHEALAARPFAEALIERAHDDGRLAALLANNLGVVHDQLGDTAAARERYEATIEILGRRPGVPDPLLAATHHNLGGMYLDQGRHDEAREHYARALERFTALLGDSHPLVAHPLGGLGDVDLQTGAVAEAIASYTRALALMEGAHGEAHLYLLHPLAGLGKAYARAGRADQALAAYRRAIEIADRLGVSHPLLAEALVGLGELRAAAGARDEARRLVERAAAVYAALPGASERYAAAALRAGELAAAAGDRPAAAEWYRKVMALGTGPEGPVLGAASAALGLGHALAARPDGAPQACALAREAREALPAEHAGRREADALLAATCAPQAALAAEPKPRPARGRHRRRGGRK